MESADADAALDIVHLDNHLLAVNKPSGLPSQPDASGDASLVDLAREYLRRRFNKPGNVYAALLHRLDRPTSGAVLVARTEKAAGRMADLFRRREIGKTYLAVVATGETPRDASLRDRLEPLANGGMRVAAGNAAGAKEARLSYRTLAASREMNAALLAVTLETGVKHQIRCQLAWAGMPVIGDFRYGPRGAPARPRQILGGRAVLLHSLALGFVHPVRREPVVVTAAPPPHWSEYLAAFGYDWRSAIPLFNNE